jgi:tRNA(fMet)-specific endonuclease VapC
VGRLIDTSIFVAYERGKFDLPGQIIARRASDVRMSVIVASELLHGVQRATDPAIKQRRSKFIERLIADFPLIPIDLETARLHAELWAGFEIAGTMIGQHDLWLAATCLRHQCSIVTGNVIEFRRVPGLVVEDWLSP